MEMDNLCTAKWIGYIDFDPLKLQKSKVIEPRKTGIEI